MIDGLMMMTILVFIVLIVIYLTDDGGQTQTHFLIMNDHDA